MCNFLSALVLKNGDVLTHPMLDSHSDLVRWFKIPDAQAHQHFAKVELTPTTDWLDPQTWAFRLDEATVPGRVYAQNARDARFKADGPCGLSGVLWAPRVPWWRWLLP